MPAGGDGYAAAACALRLALSPLPGDEFDGAIDWSLVREIARRERLSALCWARGRERISASAPDAVVEAWRADAVGGARRSLHRWTVLSSVLDRLECAGVEPIVLKGVPLSQTLYGSIDLRPSADIDLFVQGDARRAAHAALVAAGWTHLSGQSPDEGIYAGPGEPGARDLLEVHSSLADDALLGSLRPPAPTTDSVSVEGRVVRALGGDYLPAYVAVQIAKHANSPLLWLIDLATLWQSLDEAGRRRARLTAASAGAGRYLDWACALCGLLRSAAVGDERALRALGVQEDGRVRRGHNAIRVARLSATPLAAFRVARAWVWPNRDGRGTEFVGRRLARVAQGVGRLLRAPAAPPVREPMRDADRESMLAMQPRTVDGTGLVEAVRTIVTDAGGGLWIRAYGRSMWPAVPNGARVHLVPADHRALRRGDVVFALGTAGPLVHRVAARFGRRVVLQGDAMALSDVPVDADSVLARVDAVELPGGVVPIGTRPTPGAWRQLRRLPRQVAVLVGFAKGVGRQVGVR